MLLKYRHKSIFRYPHISTISIEKKIENDQWKRLSINNGQLMFWVFNKVLIILLWCLVSHRRLIISSFLIFHASRETFCRTATFGGLYFYSLHFSPLLVTQPTLSQQPPPQEKEGERYKKERWLASHIIISMPDPLISFICQPSSPSPPIIPSLLFSSFLLWIQFWDIWNGVNIINNPLLWNSLLLGN